MRSISNERGQSLIQVMIAAAIMSIISIAFMSMIVSQQKETRALEEKMSALSLSGLLVNAFAGGPVCTNMLASPANPALASHFNSAVATSVSLAVNQVPSSSTTSTPLASINSVASPNSNTLIVSSMSLDFTTVPGANSYSAQLTVNFDATKTVRALKPLAIPLLLTVNNSVPASTVITGCGFTAGLTSCPVNMTLVGTGRSAYCIDNAARAATGFLSAATVCSGLGYRLCNYNEWILAACSLGSSFYSAGSWEWVNEPWTLTSSKATIVGQASCTDSGNTDISNAMVYRCCE